MHAQALDALGDQFHRELVGGPVAGVVAVVGDQHAPRSVTA
jgi:hypothetical protein